MPDSLTASGKQVFRPTFAAFQAKLCSKYPFALPMSIMADMQAALSHRIGINGLVLHIQKNPDQAGFFDRSV